MISNITYTQNQISWVFNEKQYSKEIENIIFANANTNNEVIKVEVGKNFQSCEFYTFDGVGNMIEYHNLKTGDIKFVNKDNEKTHINIEELIAVGFYLEKGLIAILHKFEENEIMLLNINGKKIFESISPEGFKMKYFQEFPEYITVVGEGDEKHLDQFGRGLFNFKIDLNEKKLVKIGLA